MSDLIGLVEEVAGRAVDGEQVEAYAARSRSTTVRSYQGDVESLSQAASAGIGVRVVVDGRQGFAWAGTLEPDVIDETLAEARDNAAFAAPDDANGLAGPDGVEPADLDLYRASLADVPTDRKVELAIALERATVGADPRVTGVRTAIYSDGIGEAALASSTGVRATGSSTSCYLAVQAMAPDGDETHMGSGVTVGRELDALDLEQAAGDAAEQATRMIGARQPASRRLTVVLEPEITADFLGIIGGTLNGEAVLKGRSLFADRVGHQVAAPGITLVDDPTDLRSLGASRYDGEGLASRRTVLVEGGTLQGFLHNTWSARKANARSTASAVRGYSSTPGVGARALAIVPGPLTRDELVAQVGDGLLVQDVSGLHSGVNPVSGDFSVGVEGVMLRGGQPAEPIREATIASTLQRMLLDVVAVGNDLDWRPGGTGAVTLAIADVSLSGS